MTSQEFSTPSSHFLSRCSVLGAGTAGLLAAVVVATTGNVAENACWNATDTASSAASEPPP